MNKKIITLMLLFAFFLSGMPQENYLDKIKPNHERDALLFESRKKLSKAIKDAEYDYRKSYANIIAKVDSIEISKLGQKVEKDAKNEKIFVVPYGCYYSITNKTLISENDRKKILGYFIENLIKSITPNSAFDHHPQYGVRMFWDGALVFETTISLTKKNYFVQHGYEGSATWLDLNNIEFLALILDNIKFQ